MLWTYQSNNDETIIPAEPTLHNNATVEAAQTGKQHEHGEDDHQDQKGQSSGLGMIIIGSRPGQDDIYGWYLHLVFLSGFVHGE